MPLATPRVYIGVDPGQSGGIVWLCKRAVGVVKMPPTERDVWQWFEEVKERGIPMAVIEKVHAFPGSGPNCPMCGKPTRQQGVASTFKFGKGYGGLRMAMIGNGVRFEEVTPWTWQKGVGISSRKKGESSTAWKNRLKGLAQQLFPDVRVTLATADALLIAEYCRRKYKGG